jgi:Uma2 family endonuclease
MNEIFFPAPKRPTTQAAEGLPRWCWAVAEIEKLAAAGFFRENERFELVGGEIVPMSPKGIRHEIIREELAFRFTRMAPEGLFVASESQLNLTQNTYMSPDILVRPAAIKTPRLSPGDALLVVEIADTSLGYDLKTKLALYAAHGVREYWVVNAVTLMTTVHRQPSGNEYSFVQKLPPEERLVASLAPALAVSLGELDLD